MLNREQVLLIRKELIRELQEYNGSDPIELDINSKYLDEILFMHIESRNGKYKSFAIPEELRMKIDWSNVSFDRFMAAHQDFTRLKGVKINPQTIYQKDLSHSVLNGVTFTGPFNNVRICWADFTGSQEAYIRLLDLECDGKKLVDCRGTIFTNALVSGDFSDVLTDQDTDYKNARYYGDDGYSSISSIVEKVKQIGKKK